MRDSKIASAIAVRRRPKWQRARDCPIHLPAYDHYRHWIRVIVFLDTTKPYLLAILFLFLDAVFVFALSIFAMAQRQHAASYLHAPVLVLTTFVITYLSGVNVFEKWWGLAVKNCTEVEEGKRNHLFAIAVGSSTCRTSSSAPSVGTPGT